MAPFNSRIHRVHLCSGITRPHACTHREQIAQYLHIPAGLSLMSKGLDSCMWGKKTRGTGGFLDSNIIYLSITGIYMYTLLCARGLFQFFDIGLRNESKMNWWRLLNAAMKQVFDWIDQKLAIIAASGAFRNLYMVWFGLAIFSCLSMWGRLTRSL